MKRSRYRLGSVGATSPCAMTSPTVAYVATSDDTMASDCLEKLVAALEQNKDCDLAHCPLAAIDETGAPFTRPHWPQQSVFGLSDTSQLDRPHVRRAPYDGLLQLTRRLVYLSITQLLIRRSLFSRIGGFSSKWGPCGDFNWYMKAGLVANVAHVPDTWATWRVHPKQATDMTYGATAEYQRKVEEMILDAVATCEAYLPPAVLAGLKSHWLDWTRDITAYNRECRRRQRSGIRRRIYQLTQVFNGTAAARYHMVGRFLGRPRWPEEAAAEMRRWPESLGLGPMIVPAPTTGR